MKQPGKHVYGPRAFVTGAPSGIGEKFAPCGGRHQRRPLHGNYSVIKAYVLNRGEALHVELRQAGANVSDLVPLLVPLAESPLVNDKREIR